jgi:2-(3-amino-3-carboxypropyl)histidine synthase
MEEAVKIKRALEREGKSAELLVMDRIDAGSLVGYRVDAYINTACPRIATDDGFDKPMINYQEYYDCKEEGS